VNDQLGFHRVSTALGFESLSGMRSNRAELCARGRSSVPIHIDHLEAMP
jgi:hypothetical protein